MNPDLTRLQPYPFEKLGALLAGVNPPAGHPPVVLSIGEPKHPTPSFIAEELITHLHGLANYPVTRGMPALRQGIAGWLNRRYGLPEGSLDPERQVLPVNGTREALFSFAQAVIDRTRQPVVVMPNPFYQIYEGAALLAGAEPFFINTTAQTAYLPDFSGVPEEIWRRCQLLYVCSPGNPTGAVLGLEAYQALIRLADQHDFIIASDECYSEIYLDEANPPPGLLEACARMGRTDYRRCVVFHSLSKRSNVPGMRSGFVAGDAGILSQFLRYRTYHGCAMPLPVQAASLKAWGDEQHVIANRALYRDKFNTVLEILSPVMEVQRPPAGFYLWPRTPIDDAEFTRRLYAHSHVTVLPGSFLSRPTPQGNPGTQHIRLALVAPIEDCVAAAERLRDFIQTL